MIDKLKQLTFRQKALLVFAAFIMFILYNSAVSVSRIGEVGVSISVIPEDADVTMNGQSVAGNKIYIAAGKYTFSASAEGWKTDTQTVNISKDQPKVVLLPEPVSEEVNSFLKDNPDIQLEREKLGGEKFAIKGKEAAQENPIIEQLPYSQESPPFKIDFGPSKQRKGGIFLLITDSSPNGRAGALKWIRQNGGDPTDYEIVFSDYVNPFKKNVGDFH